MFLFSGKMTLIFIKQDMWSSDEIWRCQVKNS